MGASQSDRWGRQMVRNLLAAGFPGPIAAVNPRYDAVEGIDCYPRLRDLPFVPEAIELVVGAQRVLPVLEEAAELGVRAAVVFATGFAEAGPEGRALQERLVAVAREANMAVVGPNGLGAISFVNRCSLYYDNVHPYGAGRVGLISQSGQVTGMFLNNHLGVRWSHVVSGGNEAVCDAGDFLAFLVDDPHTDVIVAFLETLRDPDRFFAVCDRARAAGKPVIVLKTGRTEAARAMAVAHSGALSSPDRLFDELLRRHGVLRATSPHELLQVAIALQRPPLPGRRLAMIATSGGQIELMLDDAGTRGLKVAALTDATRARLRELLPDTIAATNPLDYWGAPDYQALFPKLLRLLAGDPNVDAVVGVADANQLPVGDPGREQFIFAAAREVARDVGKPVALIGPLGGGAAPAAVEDLLADGVLLLSGLPEAFSALAASAQWGEPVADVAPPAALDAATIDAALSRLGDQPCSGADALALLDAAGIPTPRTVAVDDSEQATAVADELGYPVVLKIGDEDVLHKTELGGVMVGLADAAAVRAGAERMLAAGARRLLVQQQITDGVELIAGITSDPQLGSFVLVGLGGVLTELLDDVAIRPVGLRAGEADEMLRALRTHGVLEGARGRPPVDRGALIAAIERIDALARAFGERLGSLDVNPLIARPDGVYAVDALVVPRR